jgi:hypothetical protein
MRKVIIRSIIAFLLILLASGLSPKPSFGYGETTYSLQVTLNASPSISFLNYQSIVPIDVSFQLKNIGNRTFNGTVTLEASTNKHTYDTLQFSVTNLMVNETYKNSTSYSTTDEGNYYFTLRIVSNDYSTINLYQDSSLRNEGVRVSTSTSAFFHSFTEFIAIMAIAVGAIVAIAVGVYQVKKKK